MNKIKKILLAILIVLSGSLVAQEEIDLSGQAVNESSGTKTVSTFTGTELTYNITKPSLLVYEADKAKATGKTVIIVPGTSLYYSIALQNEGINLAKALNEEGITAFVFKYKLVDLKTQTPEQEMFMHLIKPNAVIIENINNVLDQSTTDILSAIKHVRANATRYDIDPQQIGIAGFSTGGSIVLNAIYNYDADSRPDFVASMYPFGSLVKKKKLPGDAPQLFIATAADDKLNAAANSSISTYMVWSRAGKKADLHIYANGGNFGMKEQNTTSDRWFADFIDWVNKLKLNKVD